MMPDVVAVLVLKALEEDPVDPSTAPAQLQKTGWLTPSTIHLTLI